MESAHSERVEITQACANADICNIFDDHSIVIICISWPCRNKYYGDYVTQALAAGFLYKLAQLEEGRRYLNYSSKITNDIKRVMRKKNDVIEVDTIESLNATLNLLKPAFEKNLAISYFKKSTYEGVGKRTLSDLVQLRKYMTYDEVLMHLEMLDTYSQNDTGRTELTLHLPLILILFKHLIMEYDNSEINMPVTNILASIVSNNIVKQKESEKSDTTIMVLEEMGTQATINMKSQECQFPPKKTNTKKYKSKNALGVAPNKFRTPSKRQGIIEVFTVTDLIL
ncbi:jg23449 [Pararge aegeria aegeria]|uniref:Jg23449 protein n=1 Tax=Pararge aegeria aegeria TaxID=348720 RepID=A0A8S4S1D3_9NEOP|nr:jg23449 [Pararge aegeria aegeria]